MPEKTIAQEIAELREMRVPELVERYEEVFGKRPRTGHRVWLWRRIAWRIQEMRFGGLSTVAKRRLDELIEELDLPLGGARTVRKATRPGEPMAGTTVVRVWKGTEIRAAKVDGGWEHDGVVYRSLSSVAKAVTGSHWSGPGFFRLTKRREGSS